MVYLQVVGKTYPCNMSVFVGSYLFITMHYTEVAYVCKLLVIVLI